MSLLLSENVSFLHCGALLFSEAFPLVFISVFKHSEGSGGHLVILLFLCVFVCLSSQSVRWREDFVSELF